MWWRSSLKILGWVLFFAILSLPPAFCLPPPRLVPVPDSPILYAPDFPYDLFFVDGEWFYLFQERWYRSQKFYGPWVYLRYQSVPNSLRRIPKELRKGELGRHMERGGASRERPAPKRSSK